MNDKITLLQAILEPLDRQARKHELGEDYARMWVDRLTNVELLEMISTALEEGGVSLVKN